jgi:hypothetical protein
MSQSLLEWHDRLADHFARLREFRGTGAGGRPVFALEHGLGAEDREVLARAVRAHVARDIPSAKHALPWIVYAAEVGYDYTGDEYWQTFEQETSGWVSRGSRSWIRDQYRWFQMEYGGAVPAGRWAEWFTIICWPITHAILPRDLQRQLARVLYDIRHSYSAELFENPAMLGEFIAARTWNATSRFQNLAQDTLLVGQVAAALLLQGKYASEGLVDSSALRRITEDLDRERRGREWLRGARRTAESRARVRGLAVGPRPGSPAASDPERARAEVAALGIEPRLVLRPRDEARSSWEVSLEIPDLSHLLLRFPGARESLTESRCVVAGAAGRPLARGRCLHGSQRVPLAKWPRPAEVLLQFEKPDPQFEYLLRTECLLRPGPAWLFRIASDGLAYESRQLRVRAGQRYILVSTDGPITAGDHLRPVDLQCERVYGALLDLPSALTSQWEQVLQRLGLAQAKTVEVWPVGLSPVVWDGEGHGEWLASERPTLAIRSDHPLDALLLSITGDDQASLEVTSIELGEPVFVEFPQLPVGLHTVHVRARTGAEAEAEALGDLDVVMRIREARPWAAGATLYGPLLVQVDPLAPTLEQLWDGQVDIEARGPAGRSMRCTVLLFEDADGKPTVTEGLPPLTFPLSPERWRAHFEKHFRELKKAQGRYDMARRCRLQFTAEELGAFTVECEREFVPLRWALRQPGHGPVARLIDDSGAADLAEVSHFTFERPAVPMLLPFAREYPVATPGGLYVARQGDFTAGLIALPRIRSLEDLGGTVEIDGRPRSAEAVLEAIKIGELWGSARSSGDILSWSKRQKVVSAIVRHVLLLVGGGRWAAAEREAETGADRDLAGLKRAVSQRRDQAGIAAALALEVADLAEAELEVRVSRLAELARSFLLLALDDSGQALTGSHRWLAEFALRLASSPKDAATWAGPELRLATTKLLELPTLARAARFLVIATDRHLESQVRTGEVYAGWSWS